MNMTQEDIYKEVEPYVIHYIDLDFELESIRPRAEPVEHVHFDLSNKESFDEDYMELLIKKHTPEHDYVNAHKAHQYIAFTEEVERIQFSKKATPYFFVTINPKPEVTTEQLHNAIVKMLSHPGIINPMWSYEIRAAPDKGLHAHVFFEYHSANKNFVNRKIKKIFVPRLCGNNKHVCVKWPPLQEVETTCKYILKGDVSTSKKPSNDATLLWREKENIPHPFNESHLLVWDSVNRGDPQIDVD